MKRNLKFMVTLLKMKLAHAMVFRLSFFGGFFVDTSVFLFQLVMFRVIYANVQSIGGWSMGEMMLFVGTFSLINAINMVVYFFGLNQIPQKIWDGELDFYITKPVNPLLRLTFEHMDLGSAPLILFSIVILIFGVREIGVPVSLGMCLQYTAAVLLMTLLWYDMELIVRTIPFFLISARYVEQIEGNMIELATKVPGTLFQGVWKIIFCVILPYGIMATLPAQVLAKTITPRGILFGLGICLFFTVFAFRFWQFGRKHYKSASS